VRQTAELADLVEVLFGTQLGGGTAINQALAYCERLVQRPNDTILVLVSDLMEGGDARALCRRGVALIAGGVSVIELLARSRTTAPRRTTTNTRRVRRAGHTDVRLNAGPLPESMAAAIEKRDIGAWAAKTGIVVSRA
jgi:VWA domain containing CoxE-like protein